MRYVVTGQEMNIGDAVLVESGIPGKIVCDFDSWRCLEGYQHWLTRDSLADGSRFSSGVLIKTAELGMLYFPNEDEEIIQVQSS